MLTLALIVTVELVILFRLLIPRVLEFAEACQNEADGIAHGDWPAVPSIRSHPDFHARIFNTEAQRHHG